MSTGVALVLLARGAVAAEVPDFNLLDLAGHNHELHRAGGRAVVLFFTGTGCPIARKTPKLRDLKDRFATNGVSFWMVNSYADDKLEEMRRESRELDLRGLTYLRDSKQGVALSYGVQRTGRSRGHWTERLAGVLPRGDRRSIWGSSAPRPETGSSNRQYEEFLAGKPITTPSTKAHGCLLAFASTEAACCRREIAPLLRRHCVECHRDGGIGPWTMGSYGRVNADAVSRSDFRFIARASRHLCRLRSAGIAGLQQPYCPEPNLIWMPGYWAYDQDPG